MCDKKVYRWSEVARVVSLFFLASLTNILFVRCSVNTNDTPESVVETFAASISEMDLESVASCFEYGDEMLAFASGMSDGEYDLGEIQDVIAAAKESELLPEISYEILETDVDEEKGSVRVLFHYRFDDGETVHENKEEQVIPVYLHEGQWWIGEGYSKSEREMAKRGMKFIENFSKRRRGAW